MSGTVQLRTGPGSAVGQDAWTRRARWASPPAWLWAVSVAAQVVCAAVATGYTFFFVDDFLFLAQARTEPLNLAYFRGQLFEHFSPVSRLLDTALVTLAPGSFVLAHTLELVMYAGALVAFALVMRAILGGGWLAFGFTIAFGQSLFLMRLLNWWTATANILPATGFVLLALACYLHWRERRTPGLLLASLAAYALALLDYETAMLFPVYLALVTFVVLEWRTGPRGWLRVLSRERWAWSGYILLTGVAVANYYAFYYHPAGGHVSPGALGRFLGIALLDTFIPALIGIKYPVAPSAHPLAVVVAAIVVGGAALVTLSLRPRAWRCLVAFLAVFLVTMLPVGLSRIGQFGVSVGHVLYYQQSLQFMFLVLAAFAVSPRWSGRRSRPPLRLRADWRPSRTVLAGAGLVAVAVYAALYVSSLRSMAAASWQPLDDHAYVSTFLASVQRVRATTGAEPVLVDLDVPKQVLPAPLWPYTTFGEFFALFDRHLRVDQIAARAYVVGRHGRLVAVRFLGEASGRIAAATVSPNAGGRHARRAAAGCVPAGRQKWLRVPLATAPRRDGPGVSFAIEVRYRMPASGLVSIYRTPARGLPREADTWSRGSGSALLPVNDAREPRALSFLLPAGACVRSLTFGSLRES